ncbi:MAG: phospho-sugar mutase [Mycoplasmatales bacterium]
MNKNYQLWMNNQNLDKTLRAEIEQMTEEQIATAFGADLSFGTAGVRGIIGAGNSQMNIYTVGKITAGVAAYLTEKFKDEENLAVAICYDNRFMSQEFSQLAAQIFAANGIKVYLFSELNPTPVLSFAVRHFKCVGGVMITASHNPPAYNGYKVYNPTGAQLDLVEAEQALAKIMEISDLFAITYPEFDQLVATGKIEIVTNDFHETYLEAISDLQIVDEPTKDIKVVFSPVHGTAYKLAPIALERFGFTNIIPVKEQMFASPTFENTKSANPEEVAAFELAEQYAKREVADILLVTDPDADRLGVMYKDESDNFKLLTGNETATLLLNYILENTNIPQNGVIFKSIVTGDTAFALAKKHDVIVKETLTGFKFIGKEIEQLNDQTEYILGYEESYGYLRLGCVRDKDAIQSVVLLTEMANYYLNRQQNLGQVLEAIYRKIGYYTEKTFSIDILKEFGISDMASVMAHFRTNVRTKIDTLIVDKVVDFELDETGLPQADVLKYYFENDSWVALRPSGTEPKLKLYVSCKTTTKQAGVELAQVLYESLHAIINSLK